MKKIFTLFAAMLLALTASATTPETDFSSNLVLNGGDANITGVANFKIWAKDTRFLQQKNTEDATQNAGQASWQFELTEDKVFNVAVQLSIDTATSGHLYRVEIYDSSDNLVGSSDETSTTKWGHPVDFTLPDAFILNGAGVYTVKLSNSLAWSGSVLKNITLSGSEIPSTNFESPYSFGASAAVLSGADANFLLETNNGTPYIRYADHSQPGPVVSWTIYATRACFVNVTLNFADNTKYYAGNKHIMEVQLWNAAGNKLDTIAEGPAFVGDGFTENGVDKALTGHILIPKAGVYTIKMLNNRNHSKTGIYGITLTKETEPIDIYLKAGKWHAAGAQFGVYDRGSSSWWPEFMVNVEGDYYVFRNFPANKVYLNFVRFKDTAVAPGNDDDKWNEVVNQTRENDNNCMYITDWSAGQWRKYFPGLEAGYYLVGTHNSWEPKAADILAENVEGVEYMITKNAEEDDQFKAISIDANGFNAGWYPDGDNNEYTIPAELAGNVTIYFKPAGDDSWPDTNGGDKKFYVVRNGDPTAIDNTLVGEKAVKLMENGQIVIIKNGVRYNVLGTVIK